MMQGKVECAKDSLVRVAVREQHDDVPVLQLHRERVRVLRPVNQPVPSLFPSGALQLGGRNLGKLPRRVEEVDLGLLRVQDRVGRARTGRRRGGVFLVADRRSGRRWRQRVGRMGSQNEEA